MSWALSILVAVLTAIAAMITAGLVANAAVSWYRISSFEGGAGYFVIGVALLALIGGLGFGLIVARMVAGGPEPGFFKAAGLSLGIVLGLGSAVAVVARLLADVDPTIDGEPLHLQVEVRWPAGQTESPATLPGRGTVGLASITPMTRTRRAAVMGPLWTDDARLVDGRWIVPGAVEVFTHRGHRGLEIRIGDSTLAGFIIPLRAWPSKRDFEWTKWYPDPPAGEPRWPSDRFSVRYRILPRNQVVRTEQVGDFEIGTIAGGFFEYLTETTLVTISIDAAFELGYQGRPLPIEDRPSTGDSTPTRLDRADAVSVIPGPTPALLIRTTAEDRNGHCHLLVGAGESVRIDYAGLCTTPAGAPLTNDSTRFTASREPAAIRGWVDRETYREPGIYLLDHAVVDTRRLAIRPFEARQSRFSLVPSVPPLSLSPDERSFARVGHLDGDDNPPGIQVTDFVANQSYEVPIDPVRMRFSRIDRLDADWFRHHFHWVRGRDGVDRLEPRPDFVPLPYRGDVTLERDGKRYYQIDLAGPELRVVLIEYLVTELGAVAEPGAPDDYRHPVRIGSDTVNVSSGISGEYVMVSMAGAGPDHGLIERIADGFNAVLATGKHDGLIGSGRRAP